jgi:hypothetical protein
VDFIVTLGLLPVSAQADLVAESPMVVAAPDLMLVSVDWRAGASAPGPDTQAVTPDVRDGLSSRQSRIEQCLRGADLPGSAALACGG